MAYSCSDLASDVSTLLAIKGYRFHNGDSSTGETVLDESGADWWFTWAAPGMASCEVGDDCASSLEAEAGALLHFFGHASIPLGIVPDVRPVDPDPRPASSVLASDCHIDGGI